jgi:signal transduction histidine kinase
LRRGVLVFLVVVVLLVAGLATLLAAVVSGTTPAPWITVTVATVVVLGLIAGVRWLWRNARTIGGLMDAADRVASGDYGVRVGPGEGQLGRLTDAFDEMAGRLETNERRRRELLADVAHELRTPLQVVRGSVEGMLDGLYEPTPDRLDGLLAQTSMMARLLDDLRTLSMADEGVLVLHREPADPLALVDDIVRSFEPAAEDAAIQLRVEVDGEIPVIDVDPLRVTEIVGNLLANAIRHTPRGGDVTVRVRSAPGQVVIDVEDTGVGIAADQLASVFDRFVRSADTGGTGLGLAIAKRLVDAQGGTIAATAGPAGGTRMRVTLPG